MPLAEVLLRLLEKYRISQRKAAEQAGINFVTLNRMLNDYKFRATRETVEKIAAGIKCTDEERDELLREAGRVPEEVENKFSESYEASRLFRRITEMSQDEIKDLLEELEARSKNSKGR